VFQETSKFREHMAWRLEQKKDDYFGEHVEEIVDICTQACFRGLVLLLFRTQLVWMGECGLDII
jgi:hypothetical protein